MIFACRHGTGRESVVGLPGIPNISRRFAKHINEHLRYIYRMLLALPADTSSSADQSENLDAW